MSHLFEERDDRMTPIGALSHGGHRDPRPGVDVFEAKLGDEFPMTSHFTASEVVLARRRVATGQDAARDGAAAGPGLGHRAQAIPDRAGLSARPVVDVLKPVIDWRETGILPPGPAGAAEPRGRLVQGGNLRMAAGATGLDADRPGQLVDAVPVAIDQTPEFLRDACRDSFEQSAGLATLRRHLPPCGVVRLWSNDPADPRFPDCLATAFAQACAEPVTFHTPLTNRRFTRTVYLVRDDSGGGAFQTCLHRTRR